MYEDYLMHYGILGMRWGVRRYQNKDGSLTAEGRRHLGISNKSPRHSPSNSQKKAKQQAANLEKARQAKAAKKEFEENKKKALETGNATEVLKYKGSLTTKELQDVYNRIDWERKLAAFSASEVVKAKSVFEKMADLSSNVEKITNLTKKGIDAWNTFAKIYNSFSEGTPLRTIEGKSLAETIKEDAKKKDKEAKDKELVDYVAKYGTFDQVTKYLDQMSVKDAKDAIVRFVPGNSEEAKKKSELITDLIVNYGPDKKVFSSLDSMSISQLEAVKERLEKRSKENNKDEEDD